MLYFSVVGITFFVQSKIAFSLWFFYAVFYQLERIAITSTYGEFHDGMKTDQLFGGMVVYALTILWIGRGQWRLVARQMIGRAAPEEPTGKYLPYRAAGWGFVGCALAMPVPRAHTARLQSASARARARPRNAGRPRAPRVGVVAASPT